MSGVSSVTIGLCALAVVSTASIASAQQSQRRLTNAEKCTIYKDAFEKVFSNNKNGSLSETFIAENIAFIKSGCVDYGFVCPRNQADLNAANQLTVATMNRGLASTFVPFKCP